MNSNSSVNDSLLPEEEITPKNQRVTSRFLTKFEIAAAISLRAQDIVSGQFRYGKCLVDNSKTAEDDEKELDARQNNNKMKRRKVEEESDDDDDGQNEREEEDDDDENDDDSDTKKKNKKNSKNQKQKSGNKSKNESNNAITTTNAAFEDDDNPMLAIENQARVKALPMIFSDPIMIAKHELVQKKLPFVVKRCIGADMPSQAVLQSARGKQKFRVECIPIGDLEVDIRSIDLGEWMF